jgi:hypothetical protein
MRVLKAQVEILEQMFASVHLDFAELKQCDRNVGFLEIHANLRLVNSFLFGFSKIQDRMGAKIFKQILLELKEIDTEAVPMRDVLGIMEKLGIIEQAEDWERLREIRNLLSHDYPDQPFERLQNIELALEGFEHLNRIFIKIKSFVGL